MSAHAAGAAEPLLLLGQTRRDRLQRLLADAIAAWRERWSTASGPIVVELVEAADSKRRVLTAASAASLLARSAAAGTLLELQVPNEGIAGMLGLEVRGPVTEAGGASQIATAVWWQALHELCTTVLQRCAFRDISVERTDRDNSIANIQRAGVQVASVRFGTSSALQLFLSPRCIEALLPSSVAPTPPVSLVGRRAAIGAETISVEAHLGEAEVSLRELAQLRRGEVIVLDLPLDGRGYLAMPDGTRVADIVLGRRDGFRAVSVVAQSSHQLSHKNGTDGRQRR
jgi:hypothetical protein